MIVLPLQQLYQNHDFNRKLEDIFSITLRLLSAFCWNYKESFICSTMATVLSHIGTLKFNNQTVKKIITLDKFLIGKDNKTMLGLALYREGINAQNLPLQFLSFSKIVNIQYTGKQQIYQINKIVGSLNSDKAVARIQALKQSSKDVGEQLYKSGRCAIAHAYNKPIVDPDDPTDLYRLYQDIPIIKEVAEYIITNELSLEEIILQKPSSKFQN